MTAVLDRPASRATPPPGSAPTAEEDPAPPPRSLLVAELALLGVSLSVVVGYARLFDDGAFLAPITTAAVLGHVLAAALRRLGIGPALATLTHLTVLPLALTFLRYRSTSSWLLPSGRTLEALDADLSEAWSIFLDISAPVPPAAGFLVVAMAASWVVALVSDGLAFRLEATVEALAPATGLFLFAAILADDAHRVLSAGLFVAAVLFFALAARVARADGTGRWLATDAGRGSRSLLTAGVLLAGVAVLAALIVGPRLPGADGRPVLDLDGESGDRDRVTLSPLVDIRSRLVDQRETIAFRVEASAPAYWRLTALDDFDGQIWSSSSSYQDADGRLPTSPSSVPIAAQVRQRFEIAALDQIWLPAAFEPTRIDDADVDVDFDAQSASLVVDDDVDTADGVTYEITSSVARLAPELLDAGTVGLDTELLDHYTELPGTTAEVARRYAAEATAGVAEDDEFALARALQDWFRENFRYSLAVPPGHGDDALADFLDPEVGRIGYCEQFAGSYAALARSLGLPARVAVGFTPGEADGVGDSGDALYVVRGRNAHAWPEVYFSGIGWVAFEPTPGRGAPGAESYTGVPAQQEPPTDVTTPTTAPAPEATAPGGTRPTRDEEALPDFSTPGGDTGGGTDAVDVALIAVALGAGLWLVGVPVAGAATRNRRRRRSRGRPELEVVDAWRDSVDALALLDVRPEPAETPVEFARRAATDAGVDPVVHGELADLTTAATYGGAGRAEDATRARRAAEVVVARCRRLAGPWRRARAAVSPRRLRDRD